MNKTRIIALLLVFILILSSVVACKPDIVTPENSTKETTGEPKKEEQNTDEEDPMLLEEKRGVGKGFTDQKRRLVSVKYPVERFACMQPHSLDILTQLGVQDRIVIIEDNIEKNLGEYITKIWPDVKNLPRGGTLSEPNVTEIFKSEPNLVILSDQASLNSIRAFERLKVSTMITTLRYERKKNEPHSKKPEDSDRAYTKGLKWVVEMYGFLTETQERAQKLWDFCMQSRDIIESKIGDISDENKVKVFVAMPENQTYGNDKYIGTQLFRAGAINVAADIQGIDQYSVEQLSNWNPDYIIVHDKYMELYDMITKDPKYAELKAVKEGNVFLAPYWIKQWEAPSTDSVALGELWLAHKFYPDKISAEEVETRAKSFYKEFYGAEFTEVVE